MDKVANNEIALSDCDLEEVSGGLFAQAVHKLLVALHYRPKEEENSGSPIA